MATITSAEAETVGAVRAGRLNAAVYPVRGLEAVCGAIGLALEQTDYMVSTYRNLGDAIAKGVDLKEIVAEAYGRLGGTSKGKGGPMHLADVRAGFMATSGIVGGGIPIAVGLALAAQLDGEEQVALTTFGDGATSIGAFHEAMNMAALWDLPIVFVCQNNQWGEHTALDEYAGNPLLAERARSYGMKAVRIDGFDPIATVRGRSVGGGPRQKRRWAGVHRGDDLSSRAALWRGRHRVHAEGAVRRCSCVAIRPRPTGGGSATVDLRPRTSSTRSTQA